MAKQRRSITAEFKCGYRPLKQNYRYIETSRLLGVAESAQCRWFDQAQQKRQFVTPLSKALTREQQEIYVLEARNRFEWNNGFKMASVMSADHDCTR